MGQAFSDRRNGKLLRSISAQGNAPRLAVEISRLKAFYDARHKRECEQHARRLQEQGDADELQLQPPPVNMMPSILNSSDAVRTGNGNVVLDWADTRPDCSATEWRHGTDYCNLAMSNGLRSDPSRGRRRGEHAEQGACRSNCFGCLKLFTLLLLPSKDGLH